MKKLLIICLTLLFACDVTGITGTNDKEPGKKVVLRLDPGPGNPRNSEGDFIALKGGRIMFVYTHYTGSSGSDHGSAYLAARYSENNGKTWTRKSEKIIEQEGKLNIMSVSLLRLQNGEIALFYLKKNSMTDCIPTIRISNDETKTWSDPRPCITDREGYFVLNNNRVIQLQNGRLVFAVALHQSPGDQNFSRIGRLWSYYSDDNGRSWNSGQEVQNPEGIVTQEPGLVELKNGDILMFIRSDAGVQCISCSKDKGERWSPVQHSNIKSPLSPASIARIPSTGDLLLVWNNNDGEDPAIKGQRTPFSVAVSEDEGKTWEKIKNIETDPDGWYCYTAIHFTRKGVLLGHCAGNRKEGTGLGVTHITKLKLGWIYKTD
jgi:Neuraminidase (sialidase)